MSFFRISKQSFLIGIFLMITSLAHSQKSTQKRLEEKKVEIKKELKEINALLFTNKQKKAAAFSDLENLSYKIQRKQELIKLTNQQINLLNSEIEENAKSIEKLEIDLIEVREAYKEMILKSFKSKKLNPVKVKGKVKPIEIKEILYNRPAFQYELAYKKVEQFLLENLPKSYTYHTIDHIRDVVKQAERIAKKEKVDKSVIQDIKLAAWLHDVGYIWEPNRHEARGVEYATSILTEMKFPKSKISLIAGMILATKIPQSPKNQFEQILCDADLDYLGRDDYAINSNNLLKEIELSKKLTTKEWLLLQEKFLKGHTYFTPTSQKLRNPSKQTTLKNIQQQLKIK